MLYFLLLRKCPHLEEKGSKTNQAVMV
jgi:hypothetical protein